MPAATIAGLDNVDLWIGGLAEKIMPFGGMLGSTFNFVFEVQMEKLQNGDRFYYLQRLDGLHLLTEMENNSFATHDHAQHRRDASAVGRVLDARPHPRGRPDAGSSTTSTATASLDRRRSGRRHGILTPLVIRDNPATAGPDTNYLRYTGGDHVVLGGTDAATTP